MDRKIYDAELNIRDKKTEVDDNEYLIKLNDKDHKFVEIDTMVVRDGSLNDSVFIDLYSFPKKFNKLTNNVLSYLDWRNVVIAGGCISNIINPNMNSVSDIDLFIYGLNDDMMRGKIKNIIKCVQEYLDEKKIDYTILSNICNITILSSVAKVQLILRSYSNITEIITAFDVDCSAVAYNGNNILMTPRAYNAFVTRLNFVDTDRASTSYDYRLFKYHKRGFGLYVPYEERNMYNRFYFLGVNCTGYENLLYLLNNNKDNLKLIYNFLTCRNDTKHQNRINISSSTYGDIEFNRNKNKGTTKQQAEKYLELTNKKLTLNLRYKIYNPSDIIKMLTNKEIIIQKKDLSTIYDNNNDNTKQKHIRWFSERDEDLDYLGRSIYLQKIKEKRYDLFKTNDLSEDDGYDDISYAIIYWPGVDKEFEIITLLKMNSEIKIKHFAKYAKLSIIFNRINILKYLINVNVHIDILPLINLSIVMDNVNIYMFLMEQQKNTYKIDQNMIRKYYAYKIAHYSNIIIKNNIIQQSITKEEIEKNINQYIRTGEQPRYIINAIYNNHLSYKDFDNYSLRILLHADNLIKQKIIDQCLLNINRKVVVKNRSNYDKYDDMEKYWYDIRYNEYIEKYSTNHDEFAYNILLRLNFNEKELKEIECDNPLETTNPISLKLMRDIYYQNYNSIHNYATENIVNNSNVYKLLIHLDNVSIVEELQKMSLLNMKLLFNTKIPLQDNLQNLYLTKYYKKPLQDIIEMNKDEFNNSKDHITAFSKGVLSKDYERKENIFGMTPCDYIIFQLINYCNYTHKLDKKFFTLRENINNINLKNKIIRCNPTNISNNIENIMMSIDISYKSYENNMKPEIHKYIENDDSEEEYHENKKHITQKHNNEDSLCECIEIDDDNSDNDIEMKQEEKKIRRRVIN